MDSEPHEFETASVMAHDGVSIAYRNYGDMDNPDAVLCLPGMSRNAKDFHAFAMLLRRRYRIVVVDMRGRGQSEWAFNPESYVTATYLSDLKLLLRRAGIKRASVVGSSFGGALALRFTAKYPAHVSCLVLNDIGPGAQTADPDSIKRFLRERKIVPSWEAAADICAERFGRAFPRWSAADWRAQAQRQYRQNLDGTIEPDFDPNLAVPFEKGLHHGNDDLWDIYAACAHVPVLIVRGELSGNVSDEDITRMKSMNAATETVVAAEVGHTPTLVEDDIKPAIRDFLERNA